MTKITAAEVNKLRKHTGAGMMDCKKSLQESNGDFEKAIEYLRKKGQKVAAKRAGREASEGVVIAKTTDDKEYAAAVMLNCETDFVAKNEDFVAFADRIMDIALENRPGSLNELNDIEFDGRKISEHVTDLMGKIGEKIELSEYQFVKAPFTSAYNHMGNKLSTVVGLNKKDDEKIAEIGKEIAMQVAAMNPVAVDKNDVDEKIIEQEKDIGKEQARSEGKPEQILDKIAMGKLNKFFKESTLLNQDFVRDTKKTVRQYLAEYDKNLTVKAFKRISLV